MQTVYACGRNKFNIPLKLVNCDNIYWDFVLELRNNNREFFFNSEIINKQSHYEFMDKHHINYFICLAELQKDDWLPTGFIGFVDDDIRLVTSSYYTGSGIGTFMIKSISDIYPNLVARILLTNGSSIKAFKNAGFIQDAGQIVKMIKG